MEADITIMDVANGKWKFIDTVQKEFTGEKALEPIVTIRAGEVFTPEWGPHPWGWLPRGRGVGRNIRGRCQELSKAFA